MFIKHWRKSIESSLRISLPLSYSLLLSTLLALSESVPFFARVCPVFRTIQISWGENGDWRFTSRLYPIFSYRFSHRLRSFRPVMYIYTGSRSNSTQIIPKNGVCPYFLKRSRCEKLRMSSCRFRNQCHREQNTLQEQTIDFCWRMGMLLLRSVWRYWWIIWTKW